MGAKKLTPASGFPGEPIPGKAYAVNSLTPEAMAWVFARCAEGEGLPADPVIARGVDRAVCPRCGYPVDRLVHVLGCDDV